MTTEYDAAPGDDTEPLAPADDSTAGEPGRMPAENPGGADDVDITSPGQTVSPEYAKAFDVIGQHLQSAGVADTSVQAGLAWLAEATSVEHEPSMRRDKYANLDVRAFAADELPGLAHFLGAMHDQGVSEQDVERMLAWYLDQRAPAARHAAEHRAAVPSHDDTDRSRAERELRNRWGDSYPSKIAAAKRHLHSLPAAQRESLLNQRLADGRHALNDAQTIAWLASQGEGGHRVSASDRRIREIEGVMRSDRKRYNADAAMQNEYLRLLRQREAHR